MPDAQSIPPVQPQPVYPPGTLLNVAQSGKYLGLSARTVKRMIQAHDIEISRVGSGRGSIRISVRALDEYLARRTEPAGGSERP